MWKVGLTGSIASGKSTVLKEFAALGVPVFSSDDAVHELYSGEAVPIVEALFPGVSHSGAIDRAELAKRIVQQPERLKELEAAVHPLVRARIATFLANAETAGAALAVVDIPLLFETGFDYGLDRVATTWAPDDEIRTRALARPGMTVEKLDAILARQMSQDEKRKRADYVIATSGPLSKTAAYVKALVDALRINSKGIAVTREIVIDTETTGLNPLTGDRVVEIGGVELFNHIPTGRHFHKYINPERQMASDAFSVHGLSDEFLKDKPRFKDIVDEMIAFFGDATLIAHNAPFDVQFLNFELEKAGRPSLKNTIIDTVAVARDKHPGARVSLDALAKHYGIDNSRRTLHGALLDSEILAEIYLELIGGRQVTLALVEDTRTSSNGATIVAHAAPQRPTPLPPRLDAETLAAHMSLIKTMGEVALWGYYRDEEQAA